MKLKISNLLVAALVLIGLGCGSSNETYVTETLLNSGFIKGTFTGQRSNGQAFTFTFNHPTKDYNDFFYPEDGNQTIYFGRTKDFEGNWNGDNYSELGIELDSLDQDTVAFNYGYLESLEPVHGDSLAWFYTYNYNPNGRILTYHYDASSHTISGTFTFTGYNSGYPCTVTGSFEAIILTAVRKRANQ